MGNNRGRWRLAVLLAVLLGAGAWTGIACKASSTGSSPGAADSTEAKPIAVQYREEDLEASWDEAAATRIRLAGSSATVAGEGASANGSRVAISAAGTYVVSGTLSDGRVVVQAGKGDVVHLVLKGAAVTSADGPALVCLQAEKLVVTLAPGTANTLRDGAQYREAADDPDAALFSADDLTINGSGSLAVVGSYRHGIASKDDLVIAGGAITVQAAGDGLRGKDSIAVKEGTIAVTAGGDGLQSANDEDADKGWVSVDGGTLTVKAADDAIQAETQVQVRGGSVTLQAGGGSAQVLARKSAAAARHQPAGPWAGPAAVAATEAAGQPGQETTAARGVSAGRAVLVTGGVVTVDAADDALHSNGQVLVQGGQLRIAAGDDAVHADQAVVVAGGSVEVTASYEGLEGNTVTVRDGTVKVVAQDDGVNAVSQVEGAAEAGWAPAGRPPDGGAADQSCMVRISGGCVVIDAGGDGIDSNGSMAIEGGTVLVHGPTGNGNGALDYQGSCRVTGGILVAAGSAGMAQAPSTDSTQPSLAVSFRSVQKAGTPLRLVNEDGVTVLAFAPGKDYQSLVVSAPALRQGSSYRLYSGGTCGATALDGWFTGGNWSGGTLLTTVTLSATVTAIADDGTAVSLQAPMGGPGAPGAPPEGAGLPRPRPGARGWTPPASA
ncbi:MAG: carbohydrate-binding domain-containing protein [Syntrophomonadaceae bacterium]|nr:carbohydrate-binding domain-containing protein [Syntrophomonadaceae bacterium]